MKLKRTATKLKFPVALFVCSLLLFASSFAVFFVLLRQNNLLPHKANATGGYLSWQVFDGGEDDPGTNYNESYLTTGNVSGLKLMWQNTTPAAADNSVAYQADVDVSGTYENLVFVNTIKGNLVAYNALSGQKVWEADPSTADFNGQGTKSSPAIDPSGNFIYAYAVDGYIHKYNIATGAEVTGNGFPAQVTLLPNNIEKGSGSINIANGYLYMSTSGNDGDYGHYDGHVIAVKLSNGVETVWNSECSNITTLETDTSSDSNYCANTQSGIWARPSVKVDPVTGNVFVSTGNGNYNASSGGHNWGDSIVELTPNLTTMVDSYTPTDYASLDSNDADVGSSAPVILPTVGSSSTPYMMVQVGKDGELKLLNRANLSGQGGPGHTGGEMQTISYSNEVHEQPAVWTDGSGNIWVFVTDEGGNLDAYKLVTTSGTSRLNLAYSENIGVSSSPFVANGVIYLDGNNIRALNATTGASLFNSSSIGVSLNQHWEAPVVINGALYTPDYNGHIYALDLPGVTPTAAPTSGSSGSSGGGGSGGGSTTSSSKPSTSAAKPSSSPSTSAAKSSTPSPTATVAPVTGKSVATAHTGTASLILTVANASGKLVPNAKVTLSNGLSAYTSTRGEAEFNGLAAGKYTAKVEISGSNSYSTVVTLGGSQAKMVAVRLTSSSSAGPALYVAIVLVVMLGGVGYWGMRVASWHTWVARIISSWGGHQSVPPAGSSSSTEPTVIAPQSSSTASEVPKSPDQK